MVIQQTNTQCKMKVILEQCWNSIYTFLYWHQLDTQFFI